MTTRRELGDFLDGLTAHDLTAAVGLREFLRRCDDGGRAERGVWIASVRDALQEATHELGSHGASMLGAEGEALVHFLEARVIPRLEDAGLVRRDGEGEAWAALVADADFWRDAAADRAALLDEVDRTVRRVEQDRATAFRTEDSAAPHMGEGSRLYAEGLTKI